MAFVTSSVSSPSLAARRSAYSGSTTECLSGARTLAMESSAATRAPVLPRSTSPRRFSKTKSMSGAAESRMERSSAAVCAERNSIGSWLSGKTTQRNSEVVLSIYCTARSAALWPAASPSNMQMMRRARMRSISLTWSILKAVPSAATAFVKPFSCMAMTSV